MAGKVSAAEYDRIKTAVEKTYTKDSIANYSKAYNDAKAT
jgi:hypothetical protein